MKTQGFLNLVLVLSFLLSNLGGATISQNPFTQAKISWNIKDFTTSMFGKIDAWLDGLRKERLQSVDLTVDDILPTTTATPWFGIPPTPGPTQSVKPTLTPTFEPTAALADGAVRCGDRQ
jgi:hypothetical protein